MVRPDFLELYDYAKDKGFIFSIMTSLVALTDGILEKMAEKPGAGIVIDFGPEYQAADVSALAPVGIALLAGLLIRLASRRCDPASLRAG